MTFARPLLPGARWCRVVRTFKRGELEIGYLTACSGRYPAGGCEVRDTAPRLDERCRGCDPAVEVRFDDVLGELEVRPETISIQKGYQQ